MRAQETLASLPVRPEIRSRDGRLREGELFVPEWWPHVQLESAVSLHLMEELGNCVWGGFWKEYGVDCVVDTLPVLSELCDTFIYAFSEWFEYVSDEECEASPDMRFDVAVQHALMSDEPLPLQSRIDICEQWDDMCDGLEYGDQVVLGLRNIYEESSMFRTELLVCGPDEETARADWEYVASLLLRPEYRRVQAEQAVKDATRAIAYQQEMLEKWS